MLNTILIDDEPNALEVLKMQLERFCPEIRILKSCKSGPEGIKAITELMPDLVFLDIEMPFKNGFDVLNETNKIEYDVIFTTAYDHFAIKAFKYSALDYLLKPVDIEELKDAVKRASQRKGKSDIGDKLQSFMMQFAGNNSNPSGKIAINTGDVLRLIEPDEIVRCESDSNYTHIFLTTGTKHTVARTLKDIEETLAGLSFCRIHQSHLVNMNHIVKIVKSDGGYVITSDGAHITISRNKKEAFLEKIRKL